jgi:hypothetical protein
MTVPTNIDALRGGRGGMEEPHVRPQKTEKLDLKNALKHEKKGPPPNFFHNPKCPLKRF